MYKSREHFDYGNVHISIQPRTGEILEIYHTKNCDNLVKNTMNRIPQPFRIFYKTEGEEPFSLYPLSGHDALRESDKATKITSEETSDGLLVKVCYSHLTDGKDFYSVDMYYTVLLTENGFDFNIHVNNTLDRVIEEIRFPILPGIYLGNDYKDDTLIYPKWAGMKFPNPTDFFSKPESLIYWKWQEYSSAYDINSTSAHPRLAKQGLKGISGKYVGENSMSWMDLYDRDGGIYFACHDKTLKPCLMDVGTYGTTGPGIMMNFAFEVRLKKGEKYCSPNCVFRFHDGDWHDGAKLYREFRLPLIKTVENRIPKWAKRNVGLFAHYDFKYQTGGIVHRYSDIPVLAKEALDAGINHLLFAGWNQGGFDNGYPMYKYDPDLGTEQELISGIRKAHEMGVHVTFYVNIRLHNVKYDQDRIKSKAIMFENGDIKYSYFGNRDVKFADMCPAGEPWQNEIKADARFLTEEYGIDGIYFDVLSARSENCFNPAHNHDFDDYVKGQFEILSEVKERFAQTHDDSMMMMGEHVSDVLGGVLTYQLNQSFLSQMSGGYPNIFRYTFPMFDIIDMVYPSKNLAMRPVQIAQLSEYFMGNLFTNGSRLWIYDLVDDNTFTRDPESYAVLKNIIQLKSIMFERGEYEYVDSDGMDVKCEKAFVTRFTDKNDKNKSVLACYRIDDAPIDVRCDFKVKKAVAVLPNGSETDLRINSEKSIELPKDKAFLVFLFA